METLYQSLIENELLQFKFSYLRAIDAFFMFFTVNNVQNKEIIRFYLLFSWNLTKLDYSNSESEDVRS